MKRFKRFRAWIREELREMAEVPRPEGGYGLMWSTMKKPSQWGWVKRGERLIPAYTPEDPRLIDPNAKHSQGSVKPAQPVQQSAAQPVRPAAQPTRPGPGQGRKEYILATAKNLKDIPKGNPVVVTRENRGWVYQDDAGNKGVIPHDQVKDAIERFVNPKGELIKGDDPASLFATFNSSRGGEKDVEKEAEKENGADAPKKRSGIIEKPSDEQRATDEHFAQILASGEQSHMLLDADPGSGKTSMLNHLAWKYNEQYNGQKWLYLVFNTKNGVEAKQKFPQHAGMQIMTTNVFLGNLLSMPENLSRIPQTDRIAQKFGSGKKEGKPPEKIKFLADGTEFEGLMDNQWHVMGAGFENRKKRGHYDFKPLEKVLDGLLRGYGSIPARFKRNVVSLANLAKAYALDPRQGDLKEQLLAIVEDHKGTIDTSLEEIKENLAKKKPQFLDSILDALYDLFNYDFMSKDYRDEMCEATEWLLSKSLPYATNQTYVHKGREHDLGKLRDFSDDAWFAITYADQLVWPHYDVVMADEAQDFNQARIVMLKKLHDAGAKIVAVGDEKQSLYRFIGADDSLGKIKDMFGKLSQNPQVHQTLTKNYRSRKAVLDGVKAETGVSLNHARIYKPGDEWEGAFSKFEMDYDNTFKGIAEERAQGQQKQTAFISRTNSPLIFTALSLLKDGIPFVIIGKDVAGDLMKHIDRFIERENWIDAELLGIPSRRAGEKVKVQLESESPAILPEEISSGGMGDASQNRNQVLSLYKVLDAFLQSEHQTHGGKSTKETYLEETEQTTEAMKSAIFSFAQESKGDLTIAAFQGWLKRKLVGSTIDFDVSDEKEAEAAYLKYQKEMKELNPVILVTSHKSKGLEFGRVFILRYDQFPHPKAAKSGNEKDLKQEANAKFVALSRGMDEVHILDLNGQPGYEPKNKEIF